jgi:hypothetical protein
MLQGVEEPRECRLAARRLEEVVELVAGVPADGVGDLLQDDQQADSGEHSLDHGRGKEVGEGAGPQQAEHDLEHAREHHRQQERLEAAEILDRAEHDDRETGGGTRDAERRAAEAADHDPADDARDESGEERGAAREGDAEAERDGHEEDHDSRRDVGSKILEELHSCPSPACRPPRAFASCVCRVRRRRGRGWELTLSTGSAKNRRSACRSLRVSRSPE